MPREMPKFTKTPPEMVAAFVSAQPARADIEKKTMFGYPAFFVKGNMFAFLFGQRAAARLDRAKAKSLKAFEIMPGRGMNGYFAVPTTALKKHVADAFTYTSTLPRKTTAKKKKAAKR